MLDTNIISELRKGSRCDANVAAWYAQVESDELFLSVLTLGEIRKGVERARRRDPARARVLEHWLADLPTAYADRLIPVDRAIADEWGRMAAIRTLPIIDGLLAATAKVNDLTLVTRNVDDVTGLGAKFLNPFAPRP